MISVITTTHKRPDLLLKCIRSLQSQTVSDYEHIIFSDHCPKAKKVYDLVKEDSRITFYENPKPHIWNAGAVGKHFGVEVARFNYICYCDDDNILLPNHLQVMENNFRLGSEVVFTKNLIVDFKDYINKKESSANEVVQEILKFREADIVNSSRVVKPLYLEYGDYKFIPFDTGCIGHSKEIYRKTKQWKPAYKINTNNEDGYFITSVKIEAEEERVVYDRTYTSLYFLTNASSNIKDNLYQNKFENLKEDDIFVYPELLTKLSLL